MPPCHYTRLATLTATSSINGRASIANLHPPRTTADPNASCPALPCLALLDAPLLVASRLSQPLPFRTLEKTPTGVIADLTLTELALPGLVHCECLVFDWPPKRLSTNQQTPASPSATAALLCPCLALPCLDTSSVRRLALFFFRNCYSPSASPSCSFVRCLDS